MAISQDAQAQNIQYTQPQNLQYAQPGVFVQPASAAVPVPAATPAAVPTTSIFSLDVKSTTFWTGAAIGAGLTLLVTNESIQKTIVKTFSKAMAATAGGIEEIKEKYEDAKAEVDTEAAKK